MISGRCTPARVLEIISPAGFEGYFEQLSDLLAAEGAPPDPVKVGVIADRFGLELDLASIPRLTAEHGAHLRERSQLSSAAARSAMSRARVPETAIIGPAE